MCNHTKYSINQPYPPIIIKEKNSEYARLISHAYAGVVSELSASTQYVYQHIRLFRTKYPEISETLIGISIVEMHHLEILGELIVALGGEPKYGISKKNKFYNWTSKFVDYDKDPEHMLFNDIQYELDAIEQYNKIISVIDDNSIKKIIERIIMDEKLHVKIFKDLYKKYF